MTLFNFFDVHFIFTMNHSWERGTLKKRMSVTEYLSMLKPLPEHLNRYLLNNFFFIWKFKENVQIPPLQYPFPTNSDSKVAPLISSCKHFAPWASPGTSRNIKIDLKPVRATQPGK